MLHILYRAGGGTPQDLPKAKMWLERAVEHGYQIGRGELRNWDAVAESACRMVKLEAAAAVTALTPSGGSGRPEAAVNAVWEKLMEASREGSQPALQQLKAALEASATLPPSKPCFEVTSESYPMAALLAFRDDASVEPLLKAKTLHWEAMTLSLEGGSGEAVVERLAEAYKTAEWVITMDPCMKERTAGLCRGVLRRDPNHVAARFCMLQLRLNQLGPMRAVGELDLIIRLRGGATEPRFWSMRGCMKAFAGQYQAAADDFTQAIKLAGGHDACDPEYFYLRGVAWLKTQSNMTSAAKDFELFLHRAPPRHRKVPNALYALAFVSGTSEQQGNAGFREWYKKGLLAEAEMLPIHPPVDSPHKTMLAPLYQLNPSTTAGSHSTGPARGGAAALTNRQPSRPAAATSTDALQGRCHGCEKVCSKAKVCSRCKAVSYCSKECQVADWKQHKGDCVAL